MDVLEITRSIIRGSQVEIIVIIQDDITPKDTNYALEVRSHFIKELVNTQSVQIIDCDRISTKFTPSFDLNLNDLVKVDENLSIVLS